MPGRTWKSPWRALERSVIRWRTNSWIGLLQPEPLPNQSLQSRFVEQIVGKFLVRKHCQSGPFCPGCEFCGFLDGQVRVPSDDRHDHADHDLQAADFLGLLLAFAVRLLLRQRETRRLLRFLR